MMHARGLIACDHLPAWFLHMCRAKARRANLVKIARAISGLGITSICLTILPARASEVDSAQPTSTAADKACDDYAAVMISRTEKQYAEGLPNWKFQCEHNPNTTTCIDASDSVETARNLPPLKCGQPASAPPPTTAAKVPTLPTLPAATNDVARADNACADFAAAYISKTEKDYASKLSKWKQACEHHPVKLTCLDTQNTLESMLGASAPHLKCGQ